MKGQSENRGDTYSTADWLCRLRGILLQWYSRPMWTRTIKKIHWSRRWSPTNHHSRSPAHHLHWKRYRKLSKHRSFSACRILVWVVDWIVRAWKVPRVTSILIMWTPVCKANKYNHNRTLVQHTWHESLTYTRSTTQLAEYNVEAGAGNGTSLRWACAICFEVVTQTPIQPRLQFREVHSLSMTSETRISYVQQRLDDDDRKCYRFYNNSRQRCTNVGGTPDSIVHLSNAIPGSRAL